MPGISFVKINSLFTLKGLVYCHKVSSNLLWLSWVVVEKAYTMNGDNSI